MASGGCCQVVGDLNISGINGCITSVNVDSSTEMTDVCDDVKTGPTTGTVSLTGFASNNVYIGCPASAGVTVRWVNRYDCDKNTLHFINAGEGESFISGDTSGSSFSFDGGSVSINKSSDRVYEVLQASSSSGPTGIYMQTNRVDGYGMTYNGDILSFNTSSSMEFDNFLGLGSGKLYLKSFNLSFNSGALPTASYTFAFSIT